MDKARRSRQAGCMMLLVAAAHPRVAATPTTAANAVGATSSGVARITLIIPDQVRVMGFRDIVLRGTAGGTVSGSSPACVGRNGAGSYSVTLTSANGGFELRSASMPAAIPYRVSWADTPLSYARQSRPFRVDVASLAPCRPVAGRLTVTVPPRAMEHAVPGSYTDALYVLVAPL